MGEHATLCFETESDWEDWLEANHRESPGVWLRLGKKAAGIKSISYPEAVEVALCFGWIDGQSKRIDDRWWMQRLAPRGRSVK